MVTWAARERGVTNFVISVAPDNLASTAMAARLGFQRIGEHLDEIDGIEHVYVLRGPALAQVLDGIA